MSKEREKAAIDVSRLAFDKYAGMDAPALPVSPGSALQVRLARWQARNFGAATLAELGLGVGEEAGELQHAILKHMQGIRGMQDKDALRYAAGDAIADCVVYLMQVSTALRLDFGTLVSGIAEIVLERDWVADPGAGSARPGLATYENCTAADPAFPRTWAAEAVEAGYDETEIAAVAKAAAAGDRTARARCIEILREIADWE